MLVRGERGTAKSTAVRALAPLLPPVLAAVTETLAFGPGEVAPGGFVPCDAVANVRPAPLVELPLGATLDRLVGALDLRRALAGERVFEPGILARAHQGILYVDEVNLLADHLVDALLDAAASGVVRVEREAVSVEHDARFILVGTMNVEEGELRPQLLDRFGLGVEVRAPSDPGERADIVRRRLAYERDPAAFVGGYGAQEAALGARIATARERLDTVRLPERELLRIAGACAALGVDGVRGDLVTARAARALAALDGAEEVDETHVRRAAALALPHRRRRDPLDGRQPAPEDVERALDGSRGDNARGDGPDDGPDDGGPTEEPPGGSGPATGTDGRTRIRSTVGDSHGDTARAGANTAEAPADSHGDTGNATSDAEPPGDSHGDTDETAGYTQDAQAPRLRRDPPAPAHLPAAALELAGHGRGPLGRRARTSGPQAGAIDSRPAHAADEDVAIVATLHARLLGAPTEHVRAPIRAGSEGALLCLVVDASGSMGARRRLARVKGALLELLRDAVCAPRPRRFDRVPRPFGGAPDRAGRAARAGGALRSARCPRAGARRWLPASTRRRAADRATRRCASPLAGRSPWCSPTDACKTPHDEIPRAAAARLRARGRAPVHVIDIEDGPVRLGRCAGR